MAAVHYNEEVSGLWQNDTESHAADVLLMYKNRFLFLDFSELAVKHRVDFSLHENLLIFHT